MDITEKEVSFIVLQSAGKMNLLWKNAVKLKVSGRKNRTSFEGILNGLTG